MWPPSEPKFFFQGINNKNDSALQSTADDAIISKLSAVRAGYYDDKFLHNFVKKSSKRAPLINRGYYTRTIAIREICQRFLSDTVNGSFSQIVNLGSGLDTLFFWIKDSWTNFVYYEADFPSVIAQKSSIILQNKCLWSELASDVAYLGPNSRSFIQTDKYRMIPVDLRDIEKLSEALKSSGFDSNIPTLFISECFLVYLEPEQSNKLIGWASELVTALNAFVVYEQINPNDPFGEVMVKNLETRGCPLLGIHMYPTIDAQERRFFEMGWKFCSSIDMNKFYNLFLSDIERKRIQKLEIFDEIEEWILMLSHYFILVAINPPKGKSNDPNCCLDSLKNIWSC